MGFATQPNGLQRRAGRKNKRLPKTLLKSYLITNKFQIYLIPKQFEGQVNLPQLYTIARTIDLA